MEGEFSRQRLPLGVDLTIVRFFELDQRYVAQGAVQPALVEPVDPVEQVVEPAMRIIRAQRCSLAWIFSTRRFASMRRSRVRRYSPMISGS